MNLRLVAILAIVVAALGAAAYYFGQEREALQAEAFEPRPLIAGLDTRINDVDHLRLQSQEGGVINFARTDDGWIMEEKHGYRAHQERVAELLKRVATLTAIEPKTAKPENHERLNLDDPAGEFSLATRLTLKAGQDTVADIVAGLNRPELQGGGAFVRLWGEDQTWLTKEDFKPRRRELELLDRNVVNVDGRRVARASITHPPETEGGAPDSLAITKATPDQDAYNLAAAIPDGMKPKPDNELSTVARVSDFLIFEDVRPADDVKFDQPTVTTVETFDGLKLVYRAEAQDDGKVWVVVEAAAGDRAEGVDAFIEANKGQDSEAGRIADQLKTADGVASEINAIKKDVAGWAYRLTDYKTTRLTVGTEDVIEEVKEASDKPADDAAAAKPQ